MVSVTYSSGPPPHARHDVFAPDGLCVCVCARARARVRACVRAWFCGDEFDYTGGI